MLYSNIPFFSASQLSVFSVKEPQTYLRSSWILLKTKFKVLALFTGNYHWCGAVKLYNRRLIFCYVNI